MSAGIEAADLAARIGAQLLGADAAGALLTGASLDSRSVGPGDLYCALPGSRVHGAAFAQQAAQAGAAAALTDAAGASLCTDAGLPVLLHEDPRRASAEAAALIHHRPAERLRTVGVTGTNGKTSVTTMLRSALLDLGVPTGVMGTSGTVFRGADGTDHEIATVRTTPESPDVQAILAQMARAGTAVAAMEVSSHAMVLHRADAIVFDAVCFTNLSQDHLDFHPTMEDYFAAKASLFAPEHARAGVVCVDDEWGRRLAQSARIPVRTFTTDPAREADAVITRIAPDGFGADLRVRRTGGEEISLRAPLPGTHYAANAVAVMLLLEQIGHEGAAARAAIARAGSVPGRMELISQEPVLGVVDFSHTEDALRKALATLRAVPSTRRLIVVMGAGGDRDRSKRPAMGRAAAELADVVIVTDDNPRSEDPASIRAEVLQGAHAAAAAAEIHEVPGRSDAIALACALADESDTILVAGKGAETGQDVGGTVLPFDDREELRRRLAVAPPADSTLPPHPAEGR